MIMLVAEMALEARVNYYKSGVSVKGHPGTGDHHVK
jgi:hypothetical protein